MSSKFHVNPDTGVVGQCKAQRKCAFTDSEGNEAEHYSNFEEAYAASEKMLSELYGDFTVYKSYDSLPEVVLEEKLDKIWKSSHSHVKDAEDIRKTPIYLIDTETATDTEITRVSSAKGVYSFWDAKGNEVRRAGSFDNVAYSDVPLSEILEG
jgi:hypothetical protein